MQRGRAGARVGVSETAAWRPPALRALKAQRVGKWPRQTALINKTKTQEREREGERNETKKMKICAAVDEIYAIGVGKVQKQRPWHHCGQRGLGGGLGGQQDSRTNGQRDSWTAERMKAASRASTQMKRRADNLFGARPLRE